MTRQRDNRCHRCSTPVVEISVSVGDDRLVMRSCNYCGRSWHRGEQQLPLADVLAVASTQRRRAA